MPSERRLVWRAIFALALAFSPRVKAQDAPIPGPNPLLPPRAVYHLTLEDAKQWALATSKGLGLANLGFQEKRLVEQRLLGTVEAKEDFEVSVDARGYPVGLLARRSLCLFRCRST